MIFTITLHNLLCVYAALGFILMQYLGIKYTQNCKALNRLSQNEKLAFYFIANLFLFLAAIIITILLGVLSWS